MSSTVKNPSFFSRYRGLILSVTVFVAIITVLLGLNTWASSKISVYRAQLQATAEMRTALQTTARNLYDMKLNWGEDPHSPHIQTALDQLKSNTALFTSLEQALANGGTAQLLDGTAVTVAPVTETEGVSVPLNAVKSDWDALAPLVKNYLETAESIDATQVPLDIAVSQSQSSATRIYNNIADIAGKLTQQSTQTSKLLTYAQYIGIAVTLGYFLLFMLYFIRQLIGSDRKAAEAQRETNEILDTVQEGLFLVDENLQVGSRQSKAMKTILPGIEMENQQLGAVLQSILSERKIKDIQSYINELLFNANKKASLIRSLNPLDKVQVFIDNGQGTMDDRYLKFDFNRVYEGKEIKRVLVSVADITKSVELENRLEREREQNNRQIELLVKVLRVEPHLLAAFMRRGEETSHNINNILRRPDVRQVAFRQKIDDIFREIHSFKGEASALEFDQFVVISQEMESKLRNLREKQELSGDDFLSVAVSLDAIIEQLNILETLQDRLKSHQAGQGASIEEIREATLSNNNQAVSEYFTRFAEQAAQRNYKLVNVLADGFDPMPFDESTADIVKSIAVQLIRNAAVHGIETPEKRKAAHKPRQGSIAVHLREQGDSYDLIVEDDGAGINTEAVREKLRNMQGFTGNPDAMSHDELLRSIFLSGLSTAERVSEDAGQGVGMDVVRDRARTLGAKIAIRSKEGEFTRIVIRIPKH